MESGNFSKSRRPGPWRQYHRAVPGKPHDYTQDHDTAQCVRGHSGNCSGRGVYHYRTAGESGTGFRRYCAIPNAAAVADSGKKAGAFAQSGSKTIYHGTEGHRYAVPDCKGRNGGCTGRIRYGKDYDPASDCKMVGRGHYRLYRMRGTRQ